MDRGGRIGYNVSMGTSRAKLAQPQSKTTPPAALPFVESRRAWRETMTSPVRVGWINDDKRMEYAAGTGIDVAASGVALWAEQRLRLSALVHVEIAARGLVAIGRVRNCIRWHKGWRTGIELLPGSGD